MIGIFHAACGVLALLLGSFILLLRKGTTAHVRIGWAFAVSVLGLDLSAFGIFNLTGGVNFFHVIAVINLATLVMGLVQVLMRRRWRNWLWRHYQYMAWSYAGLAAATSNEAFVHIPLFIRLKEVTTPWLPGVVMAVIVVVSGVVIFGMQERMLSKYGGEAREASKRA